MTIPVFSIKCIYIYRLVWALPLSAFYGVSRHQGGARAWGPVLCHDLAIDHAWEQGLTLPIIDTGVTE
ncbi:hypothetical protein AR540_19330 [Pseudomonas sp. EpS/L25]|nr:hypothetical protein AR540_19330 [Pseudomonas sp. EpS/L25]